MIPEQRSIEARLDVIGELVKSEDRFSDIREGLKTVQKLDFDKLIASVSSYGSLGGSFDSLNDTTHAARCIRCSTNRSEACLAAGSTGSHLGQGREERANHRESIGRISVTTAQDHTPDVM